MSIALLMLLGLVPGDSCIGLNGDQCAELLNLPVAVQIQATPDPDYCHGIACTEETDSCCDEDAP